MINSWGRIKQESEFYEIFGDKSIPIQSINPIIPREWGCPPCFVVLTSHVEDPEVIQKLARKVYEIWQPECDSIDHAIAYMEDQGLPLKTEHFLSVSNNSRDFL